MRAFGRDLISRRALWPAVMPLACPLPGLLKGRTHGCTDQCCLSEESSCQLGPSRSTHGTLRRSNNCPLHGRFRRIHPDILNSGSERTWPQRPSLTRLRHWRPQTFAPQKHCSSPLKRDIFASVCHGHDPPRGRMATYIRRREFIFTLGGAAAAVARWRRGRSSRRCRWAKDLVTLAAHAQQEPTRHDATSFQLPSLTAACAMSYGIGRGFFRQVGFH